MPNALDNFLASGNEHFATIANDTATWEGTDYACTVSDLKKDEFFVDEGTGKKRNAERLIEFWKDVFSGALPQIGELITYLGIIYQITELESEDTTNIVFKIRHKMEAAS